MSLSKSLRILLLAALGVKAAPTYPINIFEYLRFISDDLAVQGIQFGTSPFAGLLVDMTAPDTWVASDNCSTTRCDSMTFKYGGEGARLGKCRYEGSYGDHPGVACGTAYKDDVITTVYPPGIDASIEQAFISACRVNRFFPNLYITDQKVTSVSGVLALGPPKATALARSLDPVTDPSNSFLIDVLNYELLGGGAFFFNKTFESNGPIVTSESGLYSNTFALTDTFNEDKMIPLARSCARCQCDLFEGWSIRPSTPITISLGNIINPKSQAPGKMSFEVASITFDSTKIFNIVTRKMASAYAAAFQWAAKEQGECIPLKMKKFQNTFIYQYECAKLPADFIWPRLSFKARNANGDEIEMVFDGPQALQVDSNCYLSFAGQTGFDLTCPRMIVGYPGLNTLNDEANAIYPFYVLKKDGEDRFEPFMQLLP